MKVYLVGGAVRDQQLGLTVKERDWVVVGSTPDALLQQGFKPVGKAFPVFLHPQTGEEYALARTERKVAKGYQGFTFYADSDVTLEEDLARRDLTINAMAQTEQGELIDPYHGAQDLEDKVFRHVSPAFAEDPVRILRVARFACRFSDFSIHPSTLKLMQQMVAEGEVDALVNERVWQEWYRALAYPAPQRFFSVLDQCHALAILFPEIKRDSQGIKKLATVSASLDANQRFAVLCHDLSLTDFNALQQRYRLPNTCRTLAKLVIQHGQSAAKLDKQDAQVILTLLEKTDALRREQRFRDFLAVAKHCFERDNTALLLSCLTAIKTVHIAAIQQQGLTGKAFGDAVRQKRLSAIETRRQSLNVKAHPPKSFS